MAAPGHGMIRRVPLPRSRKPLRRRVRPKIKGGKPRFKVSGQPDEFYRAWIRGRPCCVTGYVTGAFRILVEPAYGYYCRIEAAHVRARGAGGADHANLVPLEARLHAELHRIGRKSFERRHHISLTLIATVLWARYLAECGSEVG